ncbi:MAG TPA: helix-turn-helix domain-containing protein [Cellvibrio sp.]|nr:helix-turn-helix domain-containing protein [Cellvibrio sp.]
MPNPIVPINLPSPFIDNLAHLGFRSFLPHPYLQTWVQRYWIARQPRVPEQGFVEKLYPDGGTNINFRFIPNQLPEVSFNAFQTLSTMEFMGNVDLLGIRFHPGGAFQLFGLDMPALMGNIYNANELDTDINNQGLLDLRDQLKSADSIAKRIGLIDDWLLQQAAQRLAHAGPVQQLLTHLPDAENSINTLSAHVNLSRRQLERRFQQEVGLTMVYVKQLQQIKKARQLISINPERPLVDIAHEAGFYDQAHFNRQFQKINQQTPGQYRNKKRAQKHPLPDSK